MQWISSIFRKCLNLLITRDLVSVTSVCFRIYICICASICSFRPLENLHLYLCIHLFFYTIWEFTFVCVRPFVSLGQSKNLHTHTVPYLNPFLLLYTLLSSIDFWFIFFVTLFYFCAQFCPQFLPDSFRAWKTNGRGKKLQSSLIPVFLLM